MEEKEVEKYEQLIQELRDNDLSVYSLREKFLFLKKMLERICKEQTATESLQFSSLFSRIVFVAQRNKLPKRIEHRLQSIRVTSRFLLQQSENVVSERQYKEAKETLSVFLSAIYLGQEIITNEPQDEYSSLNQPLSDKIRVQVINIDYDSELLVCKIDTEEFAEPIFVKYNQAINREFNSSIARLWIGAQLNLIDARRDEEGRYIPQMFVLEPDYLIDASSLAECFQDYGRAHYHFFRRKFEQTPNSHYILMGNLANFFLDELIYADNIDKVEFQTSFLKAFKQTPFEFTSCEDIKSASDFRLFMKKAETQFNNIKRTIKNDFSTNGYHSQHAILEPSFFSEKYGIQGRLDAFQLPEHESDLYRIIELKSGGLPYPKTDPSRIASNHESQTAIYRLIIRSVFQIDNRNINSAILYSASENQGENLRFSAPYMQLEKEIINLRNLIIATEHDLYSGDIESVERLFRQMLNVDNYNNAKIPQFFVDRLSDLDRVFDKTSELEKKYFFRFVSFLARELYIQKVGDEGFESSRSISSLWNTEFAERQESFDLISDLEIEEIEESDLDMKIRFKRLNTDSFVNFREGEICIVYPRENETDSVLTNQILKGTIAEISSESLIVRFRYRQRNKRIFEKYKIWAVEHDILDHAFNAMYRGLFSFLSAPKEKKELLLGLLPPKTNFVQIENDDLDSKEQKQAAVLEKALSAEDYFLIVGPPGTGKTSIFARQLIEQLYADETKNILVIAYTNRAVDELCKAINQAFGCLESECDSFIRVGTELSCQEVYRPRLLQNISRQVKSRDELRNILQKTRIYVGTLASITGRQEIFALKKFDVAIIDEASQILEPQIVGLLPNFDKFIMIGDHKQLSTITLQNEKKSQVEEPELNDMGLLNCRESLFERLFRLSQNNNWDLAYDTLTYHGRMHQELAKFPNENFYDGVLQEASDWQTEILSLKQEDANNEYQKMVANSRLGFVSNTNRSNSVSDKINEAEADHTVDLALAIIHVYRASGMSFDAKTLGIITPYRNQIALIKHKLEETNIPELQNIMVDTVERYQGSQRDIIIVSFCLNKPYQLDFFCNFNQDKTVDRKLNVAITRARKQLFLIGNEYVLRQNEVYGKLLDSVDCKLEFPKYSDK